MKIAAYCRVSTGKDEQIDSLKNQMDFFKSYAENHGHRLVSLYADEGISGTSLKNREEFKRLMRDAEKGIFDTVVVKDISRFARNTVDFLVNIRKLKELGINTVFLTANMESLGESEFILTIFSALAQEESVNLSKRIKFGKKVNAKKGRVPPIIFGYDRVDNYHLKINEREAETVKLIFNLYLKKCKGIRAISEELNEKGLKTKLKCTWSPTAVRRVLTNPIYCGEYINNKYETKGIFDKSRIKLKAEMNFHHKRQEWAIISEECFLNVQKLLNERKNATLSSNYTDTTRRSEKHLFSSLILCECCGKSFCRKIYKYKNTNIYWKCSTNDKFGSKGCINNTSIKENILICEIKEYINKRIDKEVLIDDILKESSKIAQSYKSENNRISSLEKKRERYMEMYSEGLLKKEKLKEVIGVINSEIQQNKKAVNECAKVLSRNDAEKLLDFNRINNNDLCKFISRITVDQNKKISVIIRE